MAGLIKMRSQLAAQFIPFSSAHSVYSNVLWQKVPYFNVSRQNRVVFNCFATKQCWGMLKMWGQPLFCNQPPKFTTATLICKPAIKALHRIIKSLWIQLYCASLSYMNNSQTKSPGFNKMQCGLIVSLTRSVSFRLSLARCPALSGSLLLFEFAYKALAWLTRPLLGSQRRCRVAKCQIFYTEQIFQTKFYPKKSA